MNASERRKKNLRLYLISDKDIDIEIWGAKQKADLFENIFALQVEYKHVKPNADKAATKHEDRTQKA